MRIPLPLLLLLLLVVSNAIFAPVAYLHTELQPGARFSTFISSRGDQLFVPAESSCTHIAARACRSWAAWNIIVIAHFAKVQVIISSVCCWFLDETRVLLERTKRGEISTNSTEMSSWSKSFCIGFLMLQTCDSSIERSFLLSWWVMGCFVLDCGC
jgi:predicted small integral membrane protein